MRMNRLTSGTPPVAVRGVLAAMMCASWVAVATAQDTPKRIPIPGTVEVGAGNVSDGSYKAGEYNGLENKGAVGVGNVDFRSAASYNSASALRWRVKGTDLGLETRNVTADLRRQGKFRLSFGYDGLRRNRSDSYQTPYSGAGTNTLALPAFWQVPTVAGSTGTNNAVNVVSARGLAPGIGLLPYVDTKTTSTTMGGLLVPNAIQAAQVSGAAADLAAFGNVNLFSKRTRYDLGVNYNFNDRWGVDASVKPEHKNGLKPMGTVSRNTGGDISTPIPDLIDSDHIQTVVTLNFKGARSFAQAGFYGSSYKNHVPFMSWQNWATPTGIVNTISSAPSNGFGQVHAIGGINLWARTKLVANGSYARSTQNDPFLTSPTTGVVPVNALNGLVVSTAFNARLTSRPGKKWNLAAGYKFNDRDNRTAVHIFQYSDDEEPLVANANFPAGTNNPLGAVVAQNANANRPYSKRLNQATADADYALGKGNWIKAGYEAERINRACPGSWTDCADASITNEQTARAEWRATAGQNLNVKLGYAHARRRTPFYNENAFLALVPYANVSPLAATDGATALSFMAASGWTAYGPGLGFAPTTGNMNVFFPGNNVLPNSMYANNNRISELPGMRRYYVADRNRDKVRAAVDWQATDALSFQGGLDLNRDNYPSSTYGLQNTKGWAANFDGSYALAANVSANVFYTYEDQRAVTAGNTYTANSNAAALSNGQPGAVGLSGNGCDGYLTLQERNNNNKLDPCLNWSAAMLDRANTGGFGVRARAGKLELMGNGVLTRARWDNNVRGGNWANNLLDGPGAPLTSVAALFIPAAPLPTVTTNTVEARVSGTYLIIKGQALHVAYAYLRMTSADWAFDGMQIGTGTIAGVLPSNEQPFNYRVHVVSVSYVLTF